MPINIYNAYYLILTIVTFLFLVGHLVIYISNTEIIRQTCLAHHLGISNFAIGTIFAKTFAQDWHD